MRRALLIAAVLAATLAGCGGDDDAAEDPEAQAREAVASFFEAFGAADPEAGCETLTPEAQEQVGPLLAQVAEELSKQQRAKLGDPQEAASSCRTALESIFGLTHETTAAAISDIGEQVRTDQETVSASVEGSTGNVTFSGEGPDVPIPVAEIDGEWLVADARTILFGAGAGEN